MSTESEVAGWTITKTKPPPPPPPSPPPREKVKAKIPLPGGGSLQLRSAINPERHWWMSVDVYDGFVEVPDLATARVFALDCAIEKLESALAVLRGVKEGNEL